MGRRYTLIATLAICVVGLSVALFLVLHYPSGPLFVKETPTVHDGDTVYYEQRSFCLLTQGVRLLGIAAPELGETGGEDAKEALQSLVNEYDGRLWIDAPPEVQNDPHCRLVGILLGHRGDRVSVNERLVAEGRARICKMQNSSNKLKNLEQRLLEAQIEAVMNRKGRWAEGGEVVIAAIQYWTDPEQVVLVNRGEKPAPVEDWYLFDPEPERSGRFRLEDVLDMSTVPPRTAVLFTTRKQWDDKGDSAELYDHDPYQEGEPLDVYEYKEFH